MYMTLDDYIEKLTELKNQHGGKIKIVEKSDNYELGGAIQPVSKYRTFQVEHMEETAKTCVDSFDGTVYSVKIYKYSNNEESEKVILI